MLTNTKGFTLLEVIFAVAIILMGLGGVFALIQRNISTISFLEHQAVALGLAQEGIEVVHAIRNSNYIDAQSGGSSTIFSNGLSAIVCGAGCEIECVPPGPPAGTGEYFPHCAPRTCPGPDCGLVPFQLGDNFTATKLHLDPDIGTYTVGGGSGITLFDRKITITHPDPPDYLDVLVEVGWDEKGGRQKVEIQTRLYNWLDI